MSWIEPWEVIEPLVLNDEPLPRILGRASPEIRSILDAALDRHEVTVEEGERLLETDGDDLLALIRAADHIRAEDVGDDVTYVVNRNINFTNVCFVNCHFCAFKRQRWEADAYTHGLDVVLDKVAEAIGRGARLGERCDMRPGRLGVHVVGRQRRDAAPVVQAGGDEQQMIFR